MKSDTLVEDIKARLDITDIVSEHVELKRAGQNLKGLCPFHSEKTPSFTVSPSKQIFHCFGCHKGGDLFAFVMGYENLTFQEAVAFLAEKAGLKVEDFRSGTGAGRGVKEGLTAVHKDAVDFFRVNLKTAGHAVSYLRERGLSSETIEKFSLGYSRNERDSMLKHLKARGFAPEIIRASGLVYSGEHGPYDFFRDRVMFPIFDLQERAVAFGGRIMSSSKNAPKYINSPDSAIFRKGETVYGLNAAKNAITRKGYSVIVEGYLDVIMCHQYGIDNAVAPLGTALTSGHLKKLKKFSDKVVLIFDGDAAGIAATRRSLELVFAEGMTSKVLLLPAGDDPDSFVRRHGEEHFRKCMSRAVTPAEFALRIHGRNRLDAVRYLIHVVSACPDPLLADETVRELSERSKIHESTLREELRNIGTKRHGKEPRGKGVVQGAAKTDGISGIGREERILLNIALSVPEKTHQILDELDIEDLENPVVRGLFEKIAAVSVAGGDLVEKLLGLCSGEEQTLVTRLAIGLEIDKDRADENIEGCLRAISLRRLEEKIESAGQAGDEKLLHSLLSEKNRMLSHRS